MKLTIGNKQEIQELTAEMPVKQIQEQSKTAFAERSGGRRELVGKRGSRSKFFAEGNGAMTTKYYGKPVHYIDSSDHQYKEVDNRLKKTDDGYELNANTFKTHFHKSAKDGKIFEMEKDMCKVGLISKEAAAKNGCVLEACTYGDEGAYDACSVMLHDVKDNTDIEYTVDSERVKEDIIIKKKADQYEYNFDLSLDNLAVGVSDDGRSLELRKKDSGNVQFYIPSPFMTDAEGNYSDSVYYEIVQETENMLNMKVIADSQWINAEDRAFPVTIDPQIVAYLNYWGAYYYTDNDYEDSIFRYRTLRNGELIGNELRLYVNNADDRVYSELVILKDKISHVILDNLRKAELKIRAKKNSTTGQFYLQDTHCRVEKGEKNEFTLDVTQLMKLNESRVTIGITNAYLSSDPPINIMFEAPCLSLEYDNVVTGITVWKLPLKTAYQQGEHFDPDGMIVKALYADGSYATVTDYAVYPSGGLASYDKSVTLKYNGFTANVGITVTGSGFMDRRPVQGRENVYILHEVDRYGNKLDATEKFVRLELADGASGIQEGTALNAENLNNIKVKAANIIEE